MKPLPVDILAASMMLSSPPIQSTIFKYPWSSTLTSDARSIHRLLLLCRLRPKRIGARLLIGQDRVRLVAGGAVDDPMGRLCERQTVGAASRTIISGQHHT